MREFPRDQIFQLLPHICDFFELVICRYRIPIASVFALVWVRKVVVVLASADSSFVATGLVYQVVMLDEVSEDNDGFDAVAFHISCGLLYD